LAVNKEKVIAAAQKYVEKGQFDKAVKEYLKVTAEDPKDVRVLLKLGDTYAKNGDKAPATETYLRVAAIYSEQGFFQKAVAVFKQILRLDPRLVEVNFKLADLYRQLGLMSDAMQQYELASNFLHREGRVKEALDALRHMVDLEPENVASRIKLAEAYSKDGNTAEAIEEFTHAADSLRQTNRTDDFIKVAERLVFHQPDVAAVQLELAELYLKRSDPKRALPKLQVCFKADPRDLKVLVLLAEAFEQLGQLGKTISVLKETARIHAENGNLGARDATFRRVLQLAPGDNEALQALQPSQTGLRAAPSVRVAQPVAEPSVQPVDDEDLVDATPAVVELEVSAPVDGVVEERDGLVDEYPPGPLSGPVATVETAEPSALIDAEIEPAVEEDVAEEVVRILTETDVYIKYGLYDKALEHVRRVFELDPANLEAREKLKDLHLQVGDFPEAIAELLVLARATQAIRPGDAMAYCRQVLELESDNEPAQNLLRRLQSTPAPVAGASTASGVAAPPRVPPPAAPDLDDTADDFGKAEIDVEVDTGQFDVASEEMAEVESFDDAPVSGATLRGAAEPAAANASTEVLFEFDEDDGYEVTGERAGPDPDERADLGGGPVRPTTEPVPGTPRLDVGFDADMAAIEEVEPPDLLGAAAHDGEIHYPRALPNEPTQGFAKLPVAAPAPPAAEPDDELLLESMPTPPIVPPALARIVPPTPAPAAPPPAPPERVATPLPAAPPPAAEPSAEGVEDDLDQAEFMMQQELFDDAREVLNGVLARYPAHPLVLAKLREIDETERAAAGAGAPPPPPAPPPAAAAPPANPMFPAPPAPPAPPPALAPRASVAVPLPPDPSGSAVRRMPEQPVDLKDFETHYDLGIAYKEMGLYNDAIREFEMIAQAPGREVLCHTMIGLCYSARGMVSEAISQFKKGLYVEGITDQETISLYYELGMCYEKLDDPREALYYYEKVAKRDPKFRDVQRRVDDLRVRAEAGAADGGSGGGSPLPN
jgi:tetratricopeptide (TPR) repeat protein